MDPSSLGFIHRFWAAEDPESARTLLLLHGTGGDESDLLDLGRLLAPTANLLGVRGKVLERGAPRFFARLAEGIFDIEDLNLRTAELIEFIGKAAEVYEIDGSKITAVGYSNGANIASSVLLTQPGVLQSAILFRGMVPFDPEPIPDLGKTPVFIAAGDNDPIVSAEETERLADLLRKANADVTLEHTNAGHNLTQHDLQTAQEWLK